MDWAELEAGETLLWQGRPAPRCYTFRYWKQALAGTMLFLVSSFWLMLALELGADGYPRWLVLLPLPLILGSFIFGPLQILLARWRWAQVFYRLTDQQLQSSCGRTVALKSVSQLKLKRQGAALASLRVEVGDSKPLILWCVEQPDSLIELLKKHCPQLSV